MAFDCESYIHRLQRLFLEKINVISPEYFLVVCSHKSRDRLTDMVAEHLDHIHYLNDILCLGIGPLNEILTDYLLNRLYTPLYINSLLEDDPKQVCV